MLLFLTGMPGSGKTYWMKQLATVIPCSTVDLDTFIEQENQTTIPALFAAGASLFRKKEQEALEQVIAACKGPTLVSTGGGLPAYPGNLALMKASGTVVYLQSAISRLADRVLESPGKRPLLISGNRIELEEKLKNLFLQREAFYEEADIKIGIDNISLATFAAQIRKYIL